MKRRLLIFGIAFLSEMLIAQVPQGFNYQAIARDGLNNVIANQLLPVRITIQTSLTGGTVIWEETHSVTTTDLGIIALVIGEGENTGGNAPSFSEINWGAQPLFIKTEIDPGSGYVDMGTSQFWSVPYSMVAGNINDTLQKLVVKGETADMEEALFEVKNTDGQTVFAVYNEGVRIYIDDGDAKGKKGGFAIGGFGSSKAPGEEYLRVTRDSTRVYLNDTGTKGKKGGFAIGGFGATKGKPVDYMVVRPDSTNFYVRSITADTSSTFNILGVNMDLAQTSLLNANVDTINVFGVMNLQNDLIVNGDINVAGMINLDSTTIFDNYVLDTIMTGLKIVEKLKAGSFTMTVDHPQMLAMGYNSCTKIGDYIVYTKTAESLDRTNWADESGTAFTGDHFPVGLQIKFAWKDDGTVYMGAIGTDDEILATLVEGNFQQALFSNMNTLFEASVIQTELINLKNASLVTGVPIIDDLSTVDFYSSLSKTIFNRFSKPIFTVFSAVILTASPANVNLWPDGPIWCPYPGNSTGTGIRSFSLTYSNSTNSYVCAAARDDNGNSSYLKLNGSVVAQMSKYYANYYRETAIYPADVEIGATISWSEASPYFRMAVVGDGVTASDLVQTPAGGLSNNHAPIINVIPVY